MKRFLFVFACVLAVGAAAAEKAPAPVVTATATGEAAPELSGAWTKGGSVKLAEQRGKKVTVLYFWTVNQQSLEDMPRMAEVAKKFADRPVVFAGIGCDEVKKVAGFFRVKELPMPVLADDKYEMLRRYLRPTDRVPLAVVVDKAGRLAWRGNTASLPGALEKILSDKFDLDEHIRREKFSQAVSEALGKNHYEDALKLIDGELKRFPGNVELISVKANILYRGLKEPKQALKAADEGIGHSPKEVRFYDLKLRLLRNAGMDGELPAFYEQVCRAFADQPLVLLRFAAAEMNRPVQESRPELFHKLVTAAYSSPKFRDDRERGIATLVYARMLYLCGCPQQAFVVSKRAMPLLKGKPEYKEAQALMVYLNRINALSKKILEESDAK